MDIKKVITGIACILFSVSVYAQNGKIKGVVQYKYNDHIGYKIDIGAEVYVISKKNAPNFNLQKWNEYEDAAKVSIKYWEYLNEPAGTFPDLDTYCKQQYKIVSENFEDVALVDNSGKYELMLPYGEYYIFLKSKNRNRSFSQTENEGRILVKEVNINKPLIILSFDVDY